MSLPLTNAQRVRLLTLCLDYAEAVKQVDPSRWTPKHQEAMRRAERVKELLERARRRKEERLGTDG